MGKNEKESKNKKATPPITKQQDIKTTTTTKTTIKNKTKETKNLNTIQNCSRRKFCCFCFPKRLHTAFDASEFIKANKDCHFMWIIHLTENPQEISSLFSLWKYTIDIKLLSTAVVISAVKSKVQGELLLNNIHKVTLYISMFFCFYISVLSSSMFFNMYASFCPRCLHPWNASFLSRRNSKCFFQVWGIDNRY